jgi:nitroreductase
MRSFEDKPVPRELLDAVLDAAVWAPSGGNNQSWLFTAIQNKAVMGRLNEVIREGFQTYVPDDDYPGKAAVKEFAKRADFHFCNHAPVIIIASNRPGYENAMADCALALENIFLAAQSLGLGSCYINCLYWLRNSETVRDYLSSLGIPREHVVCNSAAIGYGKLPPAPARKADTIRVVDENWK